ncbi:unnamed protein product [Penicillium discolor]
MGLLGAIFMLREWWPLYVLGMWVYMALVPPVEAAEQTVIQKVVPFARQGRVFGTAAAMEAAAAPITAFLIAPIAEFLVIPYMDSAQGQRQWGWLLGEVRSAGEGACDGGRRHDRESSGGGGAEGAVEGAARRPHRLQRRQQRREVVVGLPGESAAAPPAAHEGHDRIDRLEPIGERRHLGEGGRIGELCLGARLGQRTQSLVRAAGGDHPGTGIAQCSRRRESRRARCPRQHDHAAPCSLARRRRHAVSSRSEMPLRPDPGSGSPAAEGVRPSVTMKRCGSVVRTADADRRLDDRLHLLVERLEEHRQRELVVQDRVGVALRSPGEDLVRQSARPLRCGVESRYLLG